MRLSALLFWVWSLFLLPSSGGRISPLAFTFVGPSNRIITPNGDMKNDTVVFFFNNPAFSDVSARIYDAKGKLVAGSLPVGPCPSSPPRAPYCGTMETREWNAKAGSGEPVAGGVYIYVLEVEGQVISGSVVVIK